VATSACSAFFVKKELVGMYGFMFFLFYLAGLLTPVPFGYFVDQYPNDGEQGYFWSTIFLIVLAAIGVLIVVYVHCWNSKNNGNINTQAKSVVDRK